MEILTSHSKLKHGFRVKGEMLYVELGSVPIDSDILKELKKDSEFKNLIKEKKFIIGTDSNGKNEKKAETIVKDAEDEALEIMQKAEDKAKKLEEEAGDRAKKLEEDAQTKADKILSDAEAKATKVVSDAEAKAKKLTQA